MPDGSSICFYYPVKSSPEDAVDYGGSSSITEITKSSNGIWDDVITDEAQYGDTEYRKIFVGLKGIAYTYTLYSGTVEISPTPAVDDIKIKKYNSNDQDNVLSDVSHTPESQFATMVTFPDLRAGYPVGIWLKRVVPVGCPAYKNNSYTLKVKGSFYYE